MKLTYLSASKIALRTKKTCPVDTACVLYNNWFKLFPLFAKHVTEKEKKDICKCYCVYKIKISKIFYNLII